MIANKLPNDQVRRPVPPLVPSLLPRLCTFVGGAGVVLLAISGVMAWQQYTTPSAAVSLVTMEDTEREVQAVAGEMLNLRFEISNTGKEPIRIVGLADC